MLLLSLMSDRAEARWCSWHCLLHLNARCTYSFKWRGNPSFLLWQLLCVHVYAYLFPEFARLQTPPRANAHQAHSWAGEHDGHLPDLPLHSASRCIPRPPQMSNQAAAAVVCCPDSHWASNSQASANTEIGSAQFSSNFKQGPRQSLKNCLKATVMHQELIFH